MKFLILFTLMTVGSAPGRKTDGDNDGADLDDFESYFDNFDLNGDDKIPLDEFLEAAEGSWDQDFFYWLDPNTNGVIIRRELPAVLGKFDDNGNGIVSWDEFYSKWTEYRK